MIIPQYFMVISQTYMVMSSYQAMNSLDFRTKSKAKDPKRPCKALPGNGKPSKGKHSAPSSKSAHKISKKIGDSRKKMDGKSFGEKLRMLFSYTFHGRILQKPS